MPLNAHSEAPSDVRFEPRSGPGNAVAVRAKASALLGPVVPTSEAPLPKPPAPALTRPVGAEVEHGGQTKRFVGTTHDGRLAVAGKKGRPQAVRTDEVRFPSTSACHPLASVKPGAVRRAGADLQATLSAVLDGAAPGHLPARRYVDALAAQGHSTYLVGGAVRDAIQGVTARDVDLVGTALPKEIRKVGEKLEAEGGQPVASGPWVDGFGAVLFGGQQLDITAMKVRSRELPKKVKALFGTDIGEDAAGRDFTMNAVYYDPKNRLVIDPTETGVRDAMSRTLRLVPHPSEANASHVMRAYKFRLRGYELAPGLAAELRSITERTFSGHGFAGAVARASPHGAKTEEAAGAWLDEVSLAMKKDGLGDLFARYLEPARGDLILRIASRNGP